MTPNEEPIQTFQAWMNLLSVPVALLDAQGRLLAANPAGRTQWKNFSARWESALAGRIVGADTGILDYFFQTQLEPSWEASLRPFSMPGLSQALWFAEWHSQSAMQRLSLVQEVSRAVNSSLILEDIFESLGDVLSRNIPYAEAVIVILDDTQNGIKILVRLDSDGFPEISSENNAFAGYDPVVEQLLRRPEQTVFTGPDLPASVVFRPGTQVALVVPLINKGVVIGLIALCRNEEGFPDEERQLLGEVCEQLAVAVENAKLYWQTQAQAGREFLINRLTKAIRQSLDIESILSTAVTELGQVLGVSRCTIRYFDRPVSLLPETQAVQALETPTSTKAFHYRMLGVPPLPTDAGAEQDVANLLEWRVFQLRKTPEQLMNPFVLNDARDCPSQLADPALLQAAGIASLAIFPIFERDALIGTITLHQCDTVRSWISEDIALLRALAEHLGVALAQARLFGELERQRRELEETLNQLQQAQMQLIQSEKMAVIGQFVAGIAHEVNTPLGSITANNSTLKSCLDRMRGEWDALSEPKPSLPGSFRRDRLETMAELASINKMACERIHEIVRNLRNFARLDESELKRVNLHDGLDSTLLLLRSAIQPHVQLEKRYASDLPDVECFPGLINQVFMNLIVNALHAMEEQPRRVLTLETTYQADEAVIEVRVRDTGKGIAPEHLAKIFDPGFTTKGVGVGTGLGLALCYRIVHKHRGEILVQSSLGEGTTFAVRLPQRLTER